MTGDKKDRLRLPLAGLDRRAFLKAMGISGVAGLAACEQLPVRKLVPYLTPPTDVTPGVPAFYSSTCTGCSAACGLMVTVRDGRPIKLEGHPDHPLSAGGLCALGQAEIRGLYDAGRLQAPSLDGAPASWKDVDARVAAALAKGGGSIEVLSTSLVSPTARHTVEAFLAKFGGTLTEFDPAPGGSTAILDAYERVSGRRVLPSFRFDKADLVVSLASDFLGTGDNPVVHTKRYAARRAEGEERGALSHVQIEGSLSLTGAAADERWPARASERRLIAFGLLHYVARRAEAGEIAAALASALPQNPMAEKAAGLGERLWRGRGRSLVVSGSSDPGEQAAVALLNRILENEGSTVNLANPSLVNRGSTTKLDELRQRLAGGTVAAMIVVGIDPVDQLPDGEKWAGMLSGLPLSVAITDRPTATAAACKVVAAAHHGLESWHDFEPEVGVMTIGQPTIRPLYATRHPFANFLFWSGAEGTDYRKHLGKRWRESVFPRVSGPASFDEFWFESRAGGRSIYPIRPEASTETVQAPKSLSELLTAPSAADGELELDLVAQVGLRDGTRSFNPWLRELPDPLSRVSWMPTIAVAPLLAKKRGLKDGDVLRVQVGEAAVEMPVHITPGQHPNVLGVPVGFGRLDGDRAKQPRNAYRLGAGTVAIKPTGGRETLPLMQEHSSTEGRAHIHQVGGYHEHVPEGHHGEVHSLWDERPEDSPHWHMTINLDACTGCSACVVACQAENNIPVVGPEEVERNRDLHWLRIDRYFVGDDANPDVLFEPMLCAQCDNAPCETVCPVAATVHSHDGLNQQAYNRCVGTRYCANNCPYKVRRFNWFEYDRGKPVERLVLNPDVVVRERGVMEKCTFCVQRIQLARIDARKEGRDVFAPQTACQQSCPANAITLGDGANPKSEVSKSRKKPRAFQALAEVGTKPSITYLARVRSRES